MIEIKRGALFIAIITCVILWYTLYYRNYSTQTDKQDLAVRGSDSADVLESQSYYGSYIFAIIEDGDSAGSHEDGLWKSLMVTGRLTVHHNDTASIEMFVDEKQNLTYNLAEGGRGMELSELVKYNGYLLSVDDRTGVVYSIETDTETDKRFVVPKYILVDGNGHRKKGFKGEWMTVKDHSLYVGGFGKPWTDAVTGKVKNYDPMWVKTISPNGLVTSLFWKRNYDALMKAAGVKEPGYMYYEAVSWSPHHHSWFFLPRKLSHEAYNEKADELMGTNILLIADEFFTDVHVKVVGPLVPSHGFSSFKFLPNSKDNIIVALKSEEVNGIVKSYLSVFDLDGHQFLDDVFLGNKKFEGIAIL